MNSISLFSVELVLTLLVCGLSGRALRPSLGRILADLCGTQERAQFWTTFSTILLIGLPLLIALTFRPQAQGLEEAFFELMRRLSGTLSGFLIAMLVIGSIVSLFALVAPRSKDAK